MKNIIVITFIKFWASNFSHFAYYVKWQIQLRLLAYQMKFIYKLSTDLNKTNNPFRKIWKLFSTGKVLELVFNVFSFARSKKH